MNRELIINSTPEGADIALLEDGKLVELHRENVGSQFNVGDIYIARVKKIIQGLNASFIDVGYEKDAFLHYTDLGPNIKSLNKFTAKANTGAMNSHLLADFSLEDEIHKNGKMKDVLKPRGLLMVQVLKEPISTKGPRLSCEITIPGRYLVLAPFNNTVGISKKIPSTEEKKRLQRLIESIRPKNFGVVIRTVAEGKSVSELHEDLTNLVDKWKQLTANLNGAQPPKKIHSELGKSSSIIRDILNESFNRIVVNDKTMGLELEKLAKKIAPEKKGLVVYHNTNKPIYDQFSITRQIKSAFGKTVTLPGGAYLVIEHTEALHVIDVNSGHKMSSDGDQQATALNVNMEAASEIARQLRLRDLGGIIIIDFIDLKNPDHKKKLYHHMKEQMKDDRARHTVLPVSKFGLIQITRQRVRPEINISTTEACPTCQGTGKIEASILILDQVEENLNAIVNTHSGIKLFVHPFIEAYLTKGWNSTQMKWFFKHKKWIKVYANNNYQLTEFHIYNSDEEEILL